MRSWDEYKKTMVAPQSLWSAAKADDVASLELLSTSTKDLNARDHRGYAPLMLAVYAGARDAAGWLLAHGADPNSSDFGGNTILMGAAFKGHVDLVRELLEAGADPSRVNDGGLTALDFATTFGRTEVAGLLRDLSPRPPLARWRAVFRLVKGGFRK